MHPTPAELGKETIFVQHKSGIWECQTCEAENAYPNRHPRDLINFCSICGHKITEFKDYKEAK